VFGPLGGQVRVVTGAPGTDRGHYWRRQLVQTARAVDFFANLANGSWWTRLKLVVLGQELRYVVAIQKVGHGETGVLALTTFGELIAEEDSGPPDGDRESMPAFTSSDHDSVTFVYRDEANARWPEAAEVIERTLAAALDAFGRHLTP
jgi:hypothetical protein